jgi:predicted PurR-regulated permease PerM
VLLIEPFFLMNSPPPPLLGPNQRQLVAYTISFACLVVIVGLIVFTIGVLGDLVARFSSLLWPLAVAGVLALMLRPVVAALQQRLRLSPLWAVVLLYAVVSLIGATLLVLLLPIVVAQIRDIAVLLPHLATQGILYLQENLPRWAEVFRDHTEKHAAIQDQIDLWAAQLGDWAVSLAPGILAAGGALLGVVAIAMGLGIVPVYLFFFLQSQADPTDRLHSALPFLKDETRNDVVFLAREFVNIIVAFFRGQLVIALIVGVLLATGFTGVGLRFSIIVGLCLGLLNIVPYLGFIVGIFTAVPIAFLQPGGGPTLAAMVAGVFIVVQSLESWYITPKIMGDRTGLHPVVIIIAIFFWGTALGGLLGMILAIPLTAFFVTAWRLAKLKYIRQIA